MLDLEERFYENKFYFSYSGLNKLLYSPSVFYNHYILNQREDRTDAHLVEGRLLHCLLLDAESFDKQFVLSSGTVPTGSTKQLIDRVFKSAVEQRRTDESMSSFQSEILDVLKDINLHQRLKTDEQRIEKILTDDAISYFEFLKNRSGKDVIDEDTYNRMRESVNVIRSNPMAMYTLEGIDAYNISSELALQVDIGDRPFGLKGILDRLVIDAAGPRIVDLKTTSKTIADFKDTVEYYGYWMQAAIYHKMACEMYGFNKKGLGFTFLVIDKYQQVYSFDVSEITMLLWRERLEEKLNVAEYHYTNRYFALPYEFATNKIVL
jgi:hypothetical protein